MTRDFGAEIRALIDAERSRGTYNSRQLAAKIVNRLLAKDVELLDGWLRLRAEELLWRRSTRSTVESEAPFRTTPEGLRPARLSVILSKGT